MMNIVIELENTEERQNSVSADPFYSEKNMSALKESIEQMKLGKIVEIDLADLKDE